MSGSLPPPDYDSIEQQMWRENAMEVPKLLAGNDPDLLKKIATYINRFGYTQREIREKIHTDSMFASQFAKEPRRQGVHEKEAAAWLQGLSAVQEFTTLPKSGAKAVYVTSDGEVKRGSELQARPSKSLDFRWRTEGTTFYAMHKFTREGGGNQDSQFNEMRQILQQFLRCPDTTCMLLVIVDGPYYKSNVWPTCVASLEIIRLGVTWPASRMCQRFWRAAPMTRRDRSLMQPNQLDSASGRVDSTPCRRYI